MNKNVSLHGSYYPNNFGDVLILAIQAKWIEELTGEKVILPYATEVYREAINSSFEKGISGIKKSKKMVYGAGGYLGEPLTNKWQWGFRLLKKHAIPAEVAKFNDIEYSIIGTGVGPITNIFARKEVVRICKNAAVLAVRDLESKNYLVKYGVPEEKINVTVDVALSLTKEDLPLKEVNNIKGILNKYNGPKYGIHIGVDMESELYGEQVTNLLNETICFLNENPNITPVLIIDNSNAHQINASNYLKGEIDRECIVYEHENIWETAALLSEMDFVLTNKLHVGIVSYALGTNCVAIPYHPKTQRFYKQIDCESLCIPLLDLRKGDALNLYNASTDEIWKDNLNKKRGELLPLLREKALYNKQILSEFLI